MNLIGGKIMPTSHHSYIVDVIDIVRRKKPKSILDIGVGFGKWGHLFREYTDIINNRIKKEDWTTHIMGYEIFKDYITAHQEEIYDLILIGDVCQGIKSAPFMDMIFMSDVLEHIEKEKGVELLKWMVRKSKGCTVVMLPMGKAWLGDNCATATGNKHEAHVSSWEDSDMEGWNCFGVYMCNGKVIKGWIR